MIPRDECSDGPGFDKPEIDGKMERGRRGRRIAISILIIYSLSLVYRALQEAGGSDAAGIAVRELQDSRRLVGWVGGLILAAALELVCYMPVGFLAGLIMPRAERRFRRLCHTLAALALAGALAVLVHAVGSAGQWRLASVVGLAFPLLGCLLGVWMGRTWLRGWRARLWFLPKFAGLVLLAGLGMGVLLWLSLEPRPPSFDAATVTSPEKRRLVRLIRSKSPRSLEQGQTHALRLTEQDINILLSWGLSLGSPAAQSDSQPGGRLRHAFGVYERAPRQRRIPGPEHSYGRGRRGREGGPETGREPMHAGQPRVASLAAPFALSCCHIAAQP
jgi:hypothetical protein